MEATAHVLFKSIFMDMCIYYMNSESYIKFKMVKSMFICLNMGDLLVDNSH